MLCEIQSVSSRIWTRVAVSISYDDNPYTTGTSFIGIIVSVHSWFGFNSSQVIPKLSQVELYQRFKKWYLIPPCLTLSIIRYGLRVNGAIYWKRSLLVRRSYNLQSKGEYSIINVQLLSPLKNCNVFISFCGMLVCLGLFHNERLGNWICYIFIFTFL